MKDNERHRVYEPPEYLPEDVLGDSSIPALISQESIVMGTQGNPDNIPINLRQTANESQIMMENDRDSIVASNLGDYTQAKENEDKTVVGAVDIDDTDNVNISN